MGIFGNLFDFNGDGELDTFEQAAELGFLAEMMKEDCDNEEEEGL